MLMQKGAVWPPFVFAPWGAFGQSCAAIAAAAARAAALTATTSGTSKSGCSRNAEADSGPPPMMTACFKMLDDLGVEPENIAFDDFGG